MRAVIQRVTRAQVSVDGACVGSVGAGYLILLGVAANDAREQADRLWDKIWNLRIMDDGRGKANRSLGDVDGGVLVVSQFTLLADCRRGRRPSFTAAGDPAHARELYEYFISRARASTSRVACGVFAAEMQVELVNDGPFTIVLDTDEL